MYITAQRVRPRDSNASDNCINTILYTAKPEITWREQRDAVMKNESPGEVVRQICEVAPGGNPVRSYLDVVAPDTTPLATVVHAIMDMDYPPRFPQRWERQLVWCRLALIGSIAPRWDDERCVLMARIIRLLGAYRNPRATGAETS